MPDPPVCVTRPPILPDLEDSWIHNIDRWIHNDDNIRIETSSIIIEEFCTFGQCRTLVSHVYRCIGYHNPHW